MRAKGRVGLLPILVACRHGRRRRPLLGCGKGERLIEPAGLWTRRARLALLLLRIVGRRLEHGRGVLGLAEGEGVGALEGPLLNLVAKVVEVDAAFGEPGRVVHLEVAADAALL